MSQVRARDGMRTNNDGDHADLIQAEVTLPAQWFFSGRRFEGEPGLCLAVLEEAGWTLKKYRYVDHPKAKRLHAAAKAWVLSDVPQYDDALSFVMVCDALGLEADLVRQACVDADWAPDWKFSADAPKRVLYRRPRRATALVAG